MSDQTIIRVRDVMAATYVMVDGLMTVYEGITLAKKYQVKALVVKKRDDNDEYGIV
ncbi:CBS domain-containing protein, partial [Vibrio parahaemolyticus]|nr:CBS domain-containing protein [Vibrio parahaemolyticus]